MELTSAPGGQTTSDVPDPFDRRPTGQWHGVIILALVSLVVIVAVVAMVMGPGWRRVVKQPEETTADVDERDDTTSGRFYEGADRPAGPDAEDPPAP